MSEMRVLILSWLLAMSIPTLADQNAAPRRGGADSPECKEITARLIQATDAQFERISKWGDIVFLRHPFDKNMTLDCMTHKSTSVTLNWTGAFPSNDWFDL